jgi:hypothetical protein
MAATVVINRITGPVSASVETNITSGSCHAGTQDSNTSPCKIQVPTSGSNYSFWVTEQLKCTVAPDNGLNNAFFYTDGGNGFGTGVDAYVIPASGYASAVGTAGSSGQLLNAANYGPTACAATSNLFLYTSSCKLTLTGTLGATTGSFANRVVLQLSVVSTAAAGNTPGETMTFTWDES